MTETLLEKAIEMAVTAHRGRFDKTQKPQILHPLRVMCWLDNGAEMIVGVLHDTVEDTDITLDDLKVEFPMAIVDAIDAISRRDGEIYRDYIDRVSKNPIAKSVKISDLLDNLNRDDGLPPNEKESLNKRYLKALEFLTGIKPTEFTKKKRGDIAGTMGAVAAPSGQDPQASGEVGSGSSNLPPCALSVVELQAMSERMGEEAHNRFIERRKQEGWHSSKECPEMLNAGKDVVLAMIDGKYCRACNPNMIPYAELPDTEKELDRSYPETFVNILDEMGLEIVPKTSQVKKSKDGKMTRLNPPKVGRNELPWIQEGEFLRLESDGVKPQIMRVIDTKMVCIQDGDKAKKDGVVDGSTPSLKAGLPKTNGERGRSPSGSNPQPSTEEKKEGDQ